MPYSAKKTCRGGCGRAVITGYCESCRGAGKNRDSRPSSASRLYGYRWQQQRQIWLREHPLCSDPEGLHLNEVRLATDLDHVTPHRGDEMLFWDEGNWQGLCSSCHSHKTATHDGGFGRMIPGGSGVR